MGSALCTPSSGAGVLTPYRSPLSSTETAVLNRWTSAEVSCLQAAWRRAGGAPPPALAATLGEAAAAALFSGGGPRPFQDFCFALALALRGDYEEQLRVVFVLAALEADGGCGASLRDAAPRADDAADDDGGGDIELGNRSPALTPAAVEAVRARWGAANGSPGVPGPVRLGAFIAWAQAGGLPHGPLAAALERAFRVLPTAADERQLVDAAAAADASTAARYIVASSWYDAWVAYAQPGGQQPPRPHPRPGEIDNGPIAGAADGELRPGLTAADVVAVSPGEWRALVECYGGGPAFVRDAAPEAPAKAHLYPLFVSVRLAHPTSGSALSAERKIVVSATASVSAFLSDTVRRHGPALAEGGAAVKAAALEAAAAPATRLWVGIPKPSDGPQRAADTEAVAAAARQGRCSAKMWLAPDSSAPLASLAGITNHAALLIEMSTGAPAVWPRSSLLEPGGFRHFVVGTRVDAMDYRGTWCAGTVVATRDAAAAAAGAAAVSEVCVHYDNFAPKWDEWHAVDSPNVTVPGAYVSSGKGDAKDKAAAARRKGHVASPAGGAKGEEGGAKLKTTPRPPGGCGLSNLGNTCYMNSVVQCLSNTPLLRAYLLASRHESELNKNNVLGTGGRMATEFAALVKSLWLDKYASVSPLKYKTALSESRTEFDGTEQHDAHEYLTLFLDMLHEDVNRVLDKPYVETPDDEELQTWSIPDQARSALDCHRLRNQSVIHDLFGGLMKTSRTCPVSHYTSVRFEHFPVLSVPLPKQDVKNIRVAVVRRVRWAPPPSVMDGRGFRDTAAAVPPPPAPLSARAAQQLVPTVYGITLQQLGDVGDLKVALRRLTGIPRDRLAVTEVYEHRFHKVFDDGEPIATFGDADTIVAYEMSASQVDALRDNLDEAAVLVKPAKQDVLEESYLEGDRTDAGAPPKKGATAAASDDAGTDAPAKVVKAIGSIEDTAVGMRCDAKDSKGVWYAGTVVEAGRDDGVEAVARVRVHFDRFAARWDEWYSREDIAARDVLAASGAMSGDRARLVEIQVFHRRPVDGGGNGTVGSKELFGLPLLVHAKSTRSCRFVHNLVVSQGMRFVAGRGGAAFPGGEGRGLGFAVRLASSASPLVAPRPLPSPVPSPPGRGPVAASLLEHGAESIGDVFDEARMCVVLEWDAPQRYEEAMGTPTDDPKTMASFHKERREYGDGGIPLMDCFSKLCEEEILTESSLWYSPKAKRHVKARVRMEPWLLPDILVVHLKRFLCSARWREKIRTKVDFPLTGLDLSSIVSADNKDKNTSGLVYDLFGVVNHHGGMTGGHYTACCKSVPCTPGGSESVASTFAGADDHRWLLFDDETVAEVCAAKVVTDAAYMLFYRRRSLSPANVAELHV